MKPHMPAVLQALRTRWPAAFPQDPSMQRPWARGMFDEIVKAGLGFSNPCIRITLKYIVKTEVYQTRLAAGGNRYDLDGNPRGIVSAEDMAAAETKLAELRAKAAREK